MRQKKRVGLAAVARFVRAIDHLCHQGFVGGGRRQGFAIGVTHHALGHALAVNAAVGRQRALHQQLAHADPKAPAHQFDE